MGGEANFGSKATKRERAIAWDRGEPYKTRVLSIEITSSGSKLGDRAREVQLRLGLVRGFRHQIRCHLAWLGLPIVGDTIYNNSLDTSIKLALKAVFLSFIDPDTEAAVHYELESSSSVLETSRP
ncbi:hypothetical protein MASR2M78_33040 [Treponema sp.]